MSVIVFIFSFLCGQNILRSFEVDGQILPFCQRCTGVYLGLGISLIYLLASGYYKTGLPPKVIIYINAAGLLIMPAFGLHWLDPGPAWRLWSGLIFGNALALLLFPAVWGLCFKNKVSCRNPQRFIGSFFLLFVFLSTVPLWFPIDAVYFYYCVIAAVLTGLFGVLFCIVAIPAFVVKSSLLGLFRLKAWAMDRVSGNNRRPGRFEAIAGQSGRGPPRRNP